MERESKLTTYYTETGGCNLGVHKNESEPMLSESSHFQKHF